MPESTALFFAYSPVLSVGEAREGGGEQEDGRGNGEFPLRVAGRYPTVAEEGLAESGWILGEDRLYSRPTLIEADYGDGRVVLFGFRPQHRGQTHATFKLFFNALLP